MKILTYLFLVLLSLAGPVANGQEPNAIMEKRVREMHRVLGLDDPAAWKKFIEENYTKTLIDKPMRAAVQEGDKGATTTQTTTASNLDAKVKMFERLHDDFGGSKIVSMTAKGEVSKGNNSTYYVMILDNGEGMKGTFQIKFEENAPYRINGLGIQADN
jgi:hypothetical protein